MPTTLAPPAVATSSGGLGPELQTLLLSASAKPLSAELLPALDWEALVCGAIAHGLVPQLHRSLAAMPQGTAPVFVQRGLDEQQRSIVQRGLRLTATLLEVHQALTAAGLRALPYKGPTLSLQLYGDPALRDAVDLDILLPRDQVMAGAEVLARLGFVPVRDYRPEIRSQLLRYRAEIGLVKDDLLVELQWRLAPKYFSVELDFEQLWQRRSTITLRDRGLPVLSPEDNLLVLCVHGAKHHWGTLKWLADVDRLLQTSPGLDWNAAMARADALGVRRIVETTLFLCAQLLETPLPDLIRDRLRTDPDISRMGAQVQADIAAGAERNEAEHHRFQLALRERRRDRWRYVWRLVWQPTESEWDAVRLPRALAWLYPVVRLARVAAKALS